jgi:hypothetical protein
VRSVGCGLCPERSSPGSARRGRFGARSNPTTKCGTPPVRSRGPSLAGQTVIRPLDHRPSATPVGPAYVIATRSLRLFPKPEGVFPQNRVSLRASLSSECRASPRFRSSRRYSDLFDHLVGGGDERFRDGEPDRLGAQINQQVVLGRELDRQITDLCTAQRSTSEAARRNSSEMLGP